MIEFKECAINGLKIVEVTIHWEHHTTNVKPAVSGKAVYLSEGKNAGLVETSGFHSPEVLKAAESLVAAIEAEIGQYLGVTTEDEDSDKGKKITGLVNREF